jgi:hypothetical protein
MSENNSTEKNLIDESFGDDKIILDKLINYFDLTPENLRIQIPFNFNNGLNNIQNKTLSDLSTELKEIVPTKEERNIGYFSEINFSLSNVSFLTSKLSQNKKTEYILLNDLKRNGYIKENPEYLGQDNEKIEKGVNFKIITRDDDKKEIYIKCIVNYDKFIENIKNNFIKNQNLKRRKQFLKIQ